MKKRMIILAMISFFSLSVNQQPLNQGMSKSIEAPSPLAAKEKGSEIQAPVTIKESEWHPAYDLNQDDSLIRWTNSQEIETDLYMINAVQDEGENTAYPQIVMKVEEDVYYGIENLNRLIRDLPRYDYNILYADEHYICLWYGVHRGKREEVKNIYTINIQSPNLYVGYSNTRLMEIQDDNDYPNAPWPSNGLLFSMQDILEEIEKGNCYLDGDAYAMYQQDQELFIESVRRQFKEIETRGYQEAYDARFASGSVDAYMAYIREGRVGFYIQSIERWEKNGADPDRDEYPYDFRIEVAYDYKKSSPAYHMPYEVYGAAYESDNCGTVYYPQVKGIEAHIQKKLNQEMKEDVLKNLRYINIEEWQEKLEGYAHQYGGWYWYYHGTPGVYNFNVAFLSKRYLCIYQVINLDEVSVLQFAQKWQRYHVYDLTTGKRLKLGDVLRLDQELVRWLKEEKRIEAIAPNIEGMQLTHDQQVKLNLDEYPEELLLDVLENTEFWIKHGQLYIRWPYYDEQSGELSYGLGGNSWPNYIQYTEARIALDDLGDFIIAEPW